MATRQDFVDFVLDQAGLFPRLGYRKMFGEYALYLDGKVVGFACDNSLFVKITAAPGDWDSLPRGEAYPGSKPYLIADELLDQPMRLAALLEATAELLPLPGPKKPRKGKRASMARASKGSGD